MQEKTKLTRRVKFLFRLYPLLAIFNILFSFLALIWFWKAGFKAVAVYNMAIFIKLAGYGFTLLLNQLRYPSYAYFYKNLGYSYRQVFTLLFITDLIIFVILLVFTWIARNYI